MKSLHLFDAFGVELEYMIVDKDSLQVKPIADELLKVELGEIGGDFENGMITWSNELVLHVIELKSTQPENDLNALEKAFVRNVNYINAILEQWNAMLLPTAAHPWMNPMEETLLWPHDNNDIYARYDQIFNSKGHGWSNLQSTHLNLPFKGDEEFAKLHAAIRILLPILPALCASSPILEGNSTEYIDKRLFYYKTNQAKLPSITGRVIPETIKSEKEYQDIIYKAIENEISPFNADELLDPVWVNSRGAMARFDRGSIEIRIMDIQECVANDMAIVKTVIEVIRLMVKESFCSLHVQQELATNSLADIFDRAIISGRNTLIDDISYLKAWGLTQPSTIQTLWLSILNKLTADQKISSDNLTIIDRILHEGSLAERILAKLNADFSKEKIKGIYAELAHCLANNQMF